MLFLRSIFGQFHTFSRFLGRADILFYTLPWLMFLVVMGTVTQKELGLYAATDKYFNSVILWLGPIPTPGGLSTIGIVFIALTVKFIFYSPWNKKKAGTLLTHLGILLLLFGGMLTAILSKEGFMIIPEGRNINQISDYFERVVNIKKNGVIVKTIDFSSLHESTKVNTNGLKINVLKKCINCGARAPSGIYENLQGLALNMELYPIKEEKQKEANFSGLILSINTGKEDELGTYIIMEDIPKNPTFKMESSEIEITLTRKTTPLPFSITLEDFRKIDYPGTKKAKEYESDLIIHDGDISWPITISMNQPLRYKGYSFYQSSFEQRPETKVTILSVVKNTGRAFPYISTLVIFLGLLLHLTVHLQKRKG